MINLFEIQKYLLDVLEIEQQEVLYKTRRLVAEKLYTANTKCYEDESYYRVATLASILLDILDNAPSSTLIPGEDIRDTFQIYRNLIYSRGTSFNDIERSAADFTQIYCGELGFKKLNLSIVGNWTNSCTLFEKVIRALTLAGWEIERYDVLTKKLVMKKEEEID